MDRNKPQADMNNEPALPVISPCIRACCLNEQDICLGCGRHLDEITGWQSASAERQYEICQTAKKRLEGK